MATAFGWFMVVFDLAFFAWDFWRALHWASKNDLPMTLFMVVMATFMAWLARYQLRTMTMRRARVRGESR